MPLKHKNSDEANKHTPKGFDNASNFSRLLRDEIGTSRYTRETTLPPAINFVDGANVPPTTVLNDVYVLIDNGGGSVNANWGGASYNDWVRFNGTNWGSVTPTAGDICYDQTAGIYKIFGTSWAQFVPDVVNIYTTDDSLTDNREVDLASFNLGFTGGNIGIGTATPDASSILDVDSTTLGSRPIPRVTTAQMNAISTPATNLVVFNTDLNSMMRYNGSAWVSMASGYGLISVTDSNGEPTYYSDLQTAINATADVDTVYIHSDIEITSTVTLPARTSLTIDLQGHRIWGDTTSGDFNIFKNDLGSGDRDIHFVGGGIIETIGTATSVINAATIYFLNLPSANNRIYFNDTVIKSINASPIYSNSAGLYNGGYFYSTNQYLSISSINAVVENMYVDTYETSTLGFMVNNCKLITRYGGFSFDQNTTVTNCYIYGTATKAGNFGLAYLHQGTNFIGNVLIADASSTKSALYVRGSTAVTNGGNISYNKVINLGTGVAGDWVYGSGYYNYCYAASGVAINVGNNCFRFIGNIGITNSASSSAIFCLGTLIQDNTGINLNASNTAPSLFVGRTNATSSEISGNKGYVNNAGAPNIRLTSTGTLYLTNNVMGLTGAGLDLNGNTNAMTNTPDAYGNIKIG